MVPVERIELPTFGLQNRCTTAVLHRPGTVGSSAVGRLQPERRRRWRGIRADRIGRGSGLADALPPPRGATAFTHFGLSGLAMSDSLSWLDGGSGDGAFAGAVWRPPPGKRGAFLHARLVETGGRGVRVRRLGASRAGE